MDSVGKRQGSQAAQMQSLAHETNSGINTEGGRLPNAVLGLPLEMSAVNTNGARAAPMQSPCAAACRAVPAEHWMGTDASKHIGRRGCLQGSPRNLRDDPGTHGDEWTKGQMQTQGLAGQGRLVKADAGRQGMARQGRNRPL